MGSTDPEHAWPCIVVADEIAIGTRGAGRVGSPLGSVAQDVLHRADCPVLVIPKRAVEASSMSADGKAATRR